MSLPNRKKGLNPLPSLELDSELINKEELIEPLQEDSLIEEVSDNVVAQELTDEDFFIAENNIKDQETNNEQKEENLIEFPSQSIDLEKKKEEKPKLNLPKPKLPKFNFDKLRNLFSRGKKQDILTKSSLNFNPKIVIGLIGILIVLIFIGSKFITKKPTENNNYSLQYVKDEYSGVVFNVKYNKNATVKVQRVYKEPNGTLVVCETEENIELLKDQETEVFASCLNNTEDVIDSNKKMIEDSVIEIK